MRYLKLFESFEDIDSICEKYGIKNYTINEDGSIDVDGFVNLSLIYYHLTELPLKFRNVSSVFSCSNNHISSLEGCPRSIGNQFNCINNEIRTLEGFPNHIGGDFYCVGSPIYQLWRLFWDKDKVELFNDFGITDGEVVILDRLNEFLEMVGKPFITDVSDIEKEGYKII